MSKRAVHIVLLNLLFILAACSSSYQSPVTEIDEPRFLDTDRIHRVNEGETLYAVAWIYDLDFMQVARANGLSEPFTIYAGQILNVDPRAAAVTSTQSTTVGTQSTGGNRQPSVATTFPVNTPSRTTQSFPAQTGSPVGSGSTSTTAAPTTATAPPVQVSPVRVQQGPVSWGWPHQGTIVSRFNADGVENKGLELAGRKGDVVMAAADGQVVYAGNGLLRYGELLIIKHNDLFLSAYAHNNTLSVSEGDMVRKGQKIAELGSTGVDRDMLHFEIRLEGKPVDPLSYLPPRS